MDVASAAALAEKCFGVSEISVLAEGGQKLALKATLRGSDVVVKVVALAVEAPAQGLERCRREVAVLANVSSPNLVSLRADLIEVGAGPEHVLWLEDYVPGLDLREIAPGQWSCGQAIKFLADCASGLAELHSHGFVHRDLSPGNVRLATDGTWVVLDPGFAKHLGRTDITGPWQPGTPGYLSPEHASYGGRILRASDIFQLGILVYERLAGVLPVDPNVAPMAYRDALLTVAVPRLETARPDLPSALAAVVNACLEAQPARRIIDGSELLLRLEGIACE